MNDPEEDVKFPGLLLDLPAELHKHVTGYLDTNSILSLRRTCRYALAERCLTDIQDRCTRLYLHPSRLAHAIKLCETPRMVEKIVELVIVGRSTQDTFDEEPREASLEDRFDNRPWPQLVTDPPDAYELSHHALAALEIQPRQSFTCAYAPLLTALGKLTKLQTLSYDGGMSEPGLCRISEDAIDRHADEHTSWDNAFGGDGQKPERYADVSHHWLDAEVMVALATTGSLIVKELVLLQPLPLCTAIQWERVSPGESSPWTPLNKIEALTFTLPGEGLADTLQKLMKKADQLKHLTFNVSSCIDAEWDEYVTGRQSRGQWIEEEWLNEIPWPLPATTRLTTLTINGTSDVPDTLCAPPIVRLLNTHKHTIQNLHLHNVIFTARDAAADHANGENEEDEVRGKEDVVGGLADVLEAVRSLTSRSSVEIEIPMLECMELEEDQAPCVPENDEHYEGCGRYASTLVGTHGEFGLNDYGYLWPFQANTFDQLANDLGVELQDGWYDFGLANTLVASEDE